MTDIPINLACEDILSEAVLKKMIQHSQRPFLIGHCFHKNGYGYLKKNLCGFNNAAKGMAYLVLTDLDKSECPLAIINEWLKSQPKHPNLLFRVAVKEVESWLLADREGFAKFLGISPNLITTDVDDLDDPKQYLINLCRRCRKKALKDAIVPPAESTAKVGKDYNNPLIKFVQESWAIEGAKVNSPSLRRAMDVIIAFQPTWN
ncbi:MAG: hypothetical protein KFF72_15055 [Arthrospira sp. SH-MAG29]|nr:hypothetical protein [Arthrospira sp. SH-MAG29]MBS0017641.1 hypothetical protein [Arthrospira sp. SH-MAG29]